MSAAKNAAGEKRRRRKTAPAKNRCRRNILLAKLAAKFGATNARRQNCRGILFRWQTNFEMATFRVIFGGPIAPSSLALKNAPNFFHHRKPFACRLKISPQNPPQTSPPKSALAMPLLQKVGLSTLSAHLRLRIPGKSGTCQFYHDKCPLRAKQLLMKDLGWHICRTKLARKILVQGTNFLTKNAPKVSSKFLNLYFVGPKNPAKFPSQK